MELKRSEFSLSVVNKAESVMTIIVEYIHFVENITQGQTFRIEVYAAPEIDLKSIVGVEYNSNNCLTLLLKNKIEYGGNYEVFFFVEEICVYQQIL